MFGFGLGVTRYSGQRGDAFVGLLDLYPNAAAAYSLRLLRSDYTGAAIKVRRSSDNEETDIGFDNNVLNTAALLAFVGAGDGFVSVWYDQSGNAINLTQTSAIRQPQIVFSGVVILLNSFPSLNFDNDYLDTPLHGNFQGFLDVYKSWNSTKLTVLQITLGSTTSGAIFYQYSGVTFIQNGNIPSIDIRDSVPRLTNWYHDGSSLGYINHNGTDYSASINGYNNDSTNRVWRIGAYPAGSTWNFIGNIQEFIIYSGNQTTNKVGIKSNINNFYGIY